MPQHRVLPPNSTERRAVPSPAPAGDARRLLIVMTAICAMLPVGTAVAFLAMYLRTGSIVFPFPDFFAFWSFGRFALTHPPAQLFDDTAVVAFQHATGLDIERRYPFLYPPTILLALLPLGELPYGAARLAWTVLGLAAYVTALSPWRWPTPLPLSLLVAPATFGCALIGQNGFWSAALMLGALRLLDTRERLAGVLFGLLAYKPQLVVLVPVALLAGGYWRAIAAAALTVAALLTLSVLVTGLGVWSAWLASMTAHAPELASGRGALSAKMPTVTAAVLLGGGGIALANAVQFIAAGCAAIAVWRVGRCSCAKARAVLPMATILGTPHAFYYDLTIVTGAALAVAAERMTQGARFGKAELWLLACVVTAPIAVVYTGEGAALVLVPLAGLLLQWVSPWRCSRTPAPAPSGGR